MDERMNMKENGLDKNKKLNGDAPFILHFS